VPLRPVQGCADPCVWRGLHHTEMNDYVSFELKSGWKGGGLVSPLPVHRRSGRRPLSPRRFPLNGSLFAARRRQPVLLLLAVTALFVTLMTVQAQAGTEAPSTAKLCANPAGQLTLPGADGCTSNTTEVALATADANVELEQRLTELALRVEDLGVENETLDVRVGDLKVENATLTAELARAEERIADLEETLGGVARDGDTLVFEGMNVQVVNGTGTTSGDPNSLGNLIIGYNDQTSGPFDRSGSHYLVVGDRHSYTAFGGIVAGRNNTASGPYASVSGGLGNVAEGEAASVTGGAVNTASGPYASVSGGQENVAEGRVASVSGGLDNVAEGRAASVSGGIINIASRDFASVSGGGWNEAEGQAASVSGGERNTASGLFASVSGGQHNVAEGDAASVSGGNRNTASGSLSSILGGRSIAVSVTFATSPATPQ
jgi:hypothetical protein